MARSRVFSVAASAGVASKLKVGLRGSTIAVLACLIGLSLTQRVRAELVSVYDMTTTDQGRVGGPTGEFGNFVPFGEDGTPSRPSPGDQMGNQVTLSGPNLNLVDVVVNFGCNNSTSSIVPQADDYTLALYANDGVGGAPGTLLGTSTVTGVTDLQGEYPVTFPFDHLPVPGTLTAVVSSTHPTNTFSGPAGLVGGFSSDGPAALGSAQNTIWYNTAGGWVSDNTWALNDGANTNYFSMRMDVPEPSSIALLTALVACGLGYSVFRRGRRS